MDDSITLYTDEHGYTWHILKREGGSMSLYATRPGVGAHYVAYDTLDGPPQDEFAKHMLYVLNDMSRWINSLIAASAR